MKLNKMAPLLAAAISLLLCIASSSVADIKLPSPRMDNKTTLFEAFKNRASAPGGDFPTAPLSVADLSDILWAATGLNRGSVGWTVPMAQGLPPYVDVYAALDSGVFLYDWKNHTLIEISKTDIRAKIGSQRFVASAPCSLVFVANKESLKEIKDEGTKRDFANVAVGAMTQDTYLAAASLNAGARYIHSLKREEIKNALRLPDDNWVVCIMMLGK